MCVSVCMKCDFSLCRDKQSIIYIYIYYYLDHFLSLKSIGVSSLYRLFSIPDSSTVHVSTLAHERTYVPTNSFCSSIHAMLFFPSKCSAFFFI